MEKAGREPGLAGSRQSDLKKSFKLAVGSLLNACSKQELSNVFSKFTSAEQERLYQLYVRIVTSLHQNIEDAFEQLCIETKVGIALDTVEQIVEEQSLDPLFPEKTTVMDIEHDLSTAKKNEIQYLMGLLEKAEEQNRLKQARIELLKKQRQELPGTADTVDKFKTGILGYFTGKDELHGR